MTDISVLQAAVEPFGLRAADLLAMSSASAVLRANTAEAAQHGAFGVPGLGGPAGQVW